MLRKYRLTSQVVFFVLFGACFFFVNTFPRPYTIPGDLFLRLNPLVALSTGIAARAIIPSVLVTGIVVAVLTIVFGRFFCGFVCPLGAAIDVSDRFFFRAARSNNRRPPRYLQRLKYVLLYGIILLAVFGAVFPLFMDPISLLTRIFTIIVHPLLKFTGAESIHLSAPLLDLLGQGKLRYITLATPVFYGIPFVLLLAAIIFGTGFWDKRFWCQYVCPSGAFFGLLSRAPFFRRAPIAEGCNSCGACARVCPTRAIDTEKVERTSSAECVLCGQCTDIKNTCSSFRFVKPAAVQSPGPDLKRRHLLFGAAAGILMVPLYKTTAVTVADGQGRLIRPPGAIPETGFLSRCIACGNCMKVCPTNALQPCLLSEGFNRLYTPRLAPRIGGCDSKCHLCGYACPTGAIRKLPINEKPYAKIGTAVIDRHRCLAWEQNRECLVCDEVCPFNAIEPRLVETTTGPFKVPVVNESLCVGCGMCENKCPIFDRAAIEVYRFGEKRLASGSYATAVQKQTMDELRRKSDKDVISGKSDNLPGFDSKQPGIPQGFAE